MCGYRSSCLCTVILLHGFHSLPNFLSSEIEGETSSFFLFIALSLSFFLLQYFFSLPQLKLRAKGSPFARSLKRCGLSADSLFIRDYLVGFSVFFSPPLKLLSCTKSWTGMSKWRQFVYNALPALIRPVH